MLLSTSGVSSVVERALLAGTQQRQGPNHQSGFGFLVFVFDGIKLFAKILLPGPSSYLVLFSVVLLFVVGILTDLQLSRSLLPVAVSVQLLS